jgi:hypothetical protein
MTWLHVLQSKLRTSNIQLDVALRDTRNSTLSTDNMHIKVKKDKPTANMSSSPKIPFLDKRWNRMSRLFRKVMESMGKLEDNVITAQQAHPRGWSTQTEAQNP